MKITPIAVAVAAAMFSLSAVANEQNKDKQAQGAQPPMSQEQKADSSTSASGGMSASGEAKTSGKAQTQAKSSQGQNPELIKQAQTKLNVTADGKVGPETQKAVKEFQQSKGLKASGQLDQETIAALGVNESASAGGSSSAKSDTKSETKAETRAEGSAAAGGSSAPQAGSSSTEQKPQQAPAPASTKQQ
jgi:peptidoglycan hydrolase-like protein with peptidoglycan-binding domain